MTEDGVSFISAGQVAQPAPTNAFGANVNTPAVATAVTTATTASVSPDTANTLPAPSSPIADSLHYENYHYPDNQNKTHNYHRIDSANNTSHSNKHSIHRSTGGSGLPPEGNLHRQNSTSSKSVTIRHIPNSEHEQVLSPTTSHRDSSLPPAAPRSASNTQEILSQLRDTQASTNTSGQDPSTTSPYNPQEKLQRSSTFPLLTPVRQHADRQFPPAESDSSSPSLARRVPASRSSLGYATTDGPPISLRTQRIHASDGSSSNVTSPEASSPNEGALGQRELLLPKSLSQTGSPDERRVSSQRPPLSYKAPVATQAAQAANAPPVRVPPIRGFRSSGSRKSLTLDMNHRPRFHDTGDDPYDPGHDRTLRALEGRQIADILQMTPPTSARNDGSDPDDSGDVFLRIAREEASQRKANENAAGETQSSIYRSYRSHRRPLSTNVASYQPTSPPPLSRRLSDQERSRSRHEDDRASEIVRSSTQRSTTWERAMSAHPAEDLHRSKTNNSALRPSPSVSRASRQDAASEVLTHTRRRSSITDQNTPPPVRTLTYRSSGTGHAHGKSYNSSPLVRSFDISGTRHNDAPQALEGTESTTSNTAPSTVWDELEDLKSRMRRLELTGKLPSTSAAAVSRLSDDRPPTATTTVTTMSSSPKRSGGGAQTNEAETSASLQRDAYPILVSALSKSRPFLNPGVFKALEAVANDAMALSSLMGVAGQPGPISSAASAVGPNSTVTDRQLRRKADSVCRSLTELCVALGEDVAHTRPVQASHSQTPSVSQYQSPTTLPACQNDGPSTPTINKPYTSLVQNRPDVVAEQPPPQPTTSPSRTMSKFEERRNTILNGSTLPSPRAPTSGPTTPQEPNTSRRSSLLFRRTRRAATEEPEDAGGRRSSLLLRTRRGGTEEPEEGRQTSFMYRGRRGTIGDEEDENRPSATPRAYTEVNTTRSSNREYTEVATSSRAPTREYAPQAPASADESAAQPASALPRRRFVSSSASVSRLATPSTAASPSSALPTRKYLERAVPERDVSNPVDKQYGERPQRYHSLGQTLSLNRSSTLNSRRQNRDSTISSVSTAATAGGYR